ncbi:MAG TPA: lipid-A-disaccharide synthase [Alphaproteobacteria bacterium]
MIDPNSIYVIAGEMSGDVLGARLMTAIRQITQRPITFAGIGGSFMRDAGLVSLFPMRDLSVMGLMEVLPRLPKLMGRINQTVQDIAARQPAVVITIDSPGFAFRVAQKARKVSPGTKFVHYVAPQVWAWKPKRAEKVARLFDGLMCLLPFEPEYFTPYGLRAQFVGHPVVDLPDTVNIDRTAFYEKYDLSLNQPPAILSVLFGSRESEIDRMGSPLYEAAYRVLSEWPNVAVLVPTAPHLWQRLKGLIGADQRFIPVDVEDRFQAFALSHAALATSGTVGLELAMLSVPHAVAYRFSPITYQIAKRVVKIPYMHLINLMYGQMVVPEFLQKQANGINLAHTALDLLINKNGTCNAQREAFGQIRHMLMGEQGGSPAQQAAAFVLSYLS